MGTIITLLLGMLIQFLIVRFYGKDRLSEKIEEENTRLEYEVKTLHQNMGSLEALLSSKDNDLNEEVRKAQQLEDMYNREIENNRKILSQKKSSEIRTGFIAESLAPFTMENHNPRNLRFLGMPIDYIAFEDNGVYLIEVKSGKSDLSYNQKKIKKLVQEKKVFWEEVRLSGKNLKKESINNEVDSRKGKKPIIQGS